MKIRYNAREIEIVCYFRKKTNKSANNLYSFSVFYLNEKCSVNSTFLCILKCTKNTKHCYTNANTTRTLLVYIDYFIIQGFKQVTMLLFSSPWSYSLLHHKAFSVKKFTMVKKHYLRWTHMWNYHNNIVVKHHSITDYWARNQRNILGTYFLLLLT